MFIWYLREVYFVYTLVYKRARDKTQHLAFCWLLSARHLQSYVVCLSLSYDYTVIGTYFLSFQPLASCIWPHLTGMWFLLTEALLLLHLQLYLITDALALQVGDASGIQSPVSFGGFGSLTRHLGRLSSGLSVEFSLS